MLNAVSLLCTTLVGLVLLATGVIKALSPAPFYLHMDRMHVLPYGALRYLIGGSTLIQCVLGWALILRLYPPIVLPATIGLLAVFALFTAWSWLARGAKECGCYGGLLAVSSANSLLLDAAYTAMVAFAWWHPVSFGWRPATEWTLLFEPGLVFASVIFMSTWVYRNWGEDMVVLTPIQVNKIWNADWLQGYRELPKADHRLIVLMSPTCSSCQEWTGPLNKIHRRDDMPQVVAGMAGDEHARTHFVAQYGIEFPLLPVAEETMDRLVRAYPTVIEVRGDRIASRAEAALPAYLLDRLRSSRQLADVTQQLFGRLRPSATDVKVVSKS